MLKLDQFMEIHVLRRQGHSIRQISELTGCARNTVRRALRAEGLPGYRREPRPSRLDPFKEYLRQRWEEYGLSAVRLLEEIRPRGYPGSVQIVRRYLHQLRAAAEVSARLTVRFETPPGEQAQADWAEIGQFTRPDGQRVRLYLFVMVLGYSRYLYAECTRSMRVETLIRAHQNAFAELGGWPRSILYDNMRQVGQGPGQFNPLFADFAHYHGFAIRRHRIRRPRTKGKVERAVGYVKDNFLNGRSFASPEDLAAQLTQWRHTVANVRDHATTGTRPCDRLAQEGLSAMGSRPPYQLVHSTQRTVSVEALVQFDRSLYSVPARWTGRRVVVEATPGHVRIRQGDLIVAEHPRSEVPGSRIEQPDHVQQRWELSQPTHRPAPQRGCRIRWEEPTVDVRPLCAYEEVGS